MAYTVRVRGVDIGRSELENHDPGMGVAYGAFRPGAGYELVQDIFRLYADAAPNDGLGTRDEEKLERYYAARDALGLELVDKSGKLVPTTAIDISDYSKEAGTGAYEIMVYLTHPDDWSS